MDLAALLLVSMLSFTIYHDNYRRLKRYLLFLAACTRRQASGEISLFLRPALILRKIRVRTIQNFVKKSGQNLPAILNFLCRLDFSHLNIEPQVEGKSMNCSAVITIFILGGKAHYEC
jgi:hypothetical protein